MRFRSLLALLCFTGIPIVHALGEETANLEFASTPLGNVEPDKALLAIRISSAEGCRLALLTSGSTSGTLCIVLDGKPGPEFGGILNRTPVFSPDEKRAVYGGRRGEKWIVYEANQAAEPDTGPKWDRILETSFSFSADSKHLAYVARRDGGWYVVADGKENGPYEDITNLPVFSADGQHLTYGIRKGGKQLIINQGEECAGFEAVGGAVLSPDGKRMAFGAQQDGRQFVVVDGQPGERYGGVYAETLQFSPDSKHVAYAAEKGIRRFLVIDGKEQTDFEAIGRGSLRISPNSARFGYVARRGEKWRIVVDGKEGAPYDKVENLAFSADSRHFAYLAGDDAGRYVVFDDKSGPEYPEIVKDSLVFSPTGASLAYCAVQENKKTAVILDGKTLGEYDGVGSVSFSPDGKHLVYRATLGGQLFVCIDGKQALGPSSIVCEPVFRRDGAIECMLIENKKLCRVSTKPLTP